MVPNSLIILDQLFRLSLRAQFAVENEPINQLHGSASPEEAEREITFFFPQQQTLAVIKPDALEEHRGPALMFMKSYLSLHETIVISSS